MLKSHLALTLLAGLLCQAAPAEPLTAAKQADIQRLMTITGSANLAGQFAAAGSQQMFQALKAVRPEIPDRAYTVMHGELTTLLNERIATPGGLLEQLVPVYARHFTHQEIRELLAFYQTPLGRKTIQVLPQVASESMAAGQRWGQSLAPEMQQRVQTALRREGLLQGR